jgi:polyhydroxyalkanoate synthase
MSRSGDRRRPLEAAVDLQERTLENLGELAETAILAPDRIETMAEVGVGETPSEVVYSENKLDLLHYEPRTDDQLDVPVLVVYALINRPYILDLQPDRSVVRRLLDAGLDVYLIEWGEPSTLDASLTLYDYVERYIANCVDVVRERSGQDAINVLGYCMGGTMSAMYAARHPETVRNLGLMAAGLCFEDTGGVLERWGSEPYDPAALTDAFGNAPGDLLSVGFAMLDPVQNYVTKYVRLLDNLEDEAFVANFARMERWLRDPVDVAGATYVEFLEKLYQEDRLMRNDLSLDGEHVDVENLTMPVLQIVAEYDHLVPPASSLPFNDVIPSDDVSVVKSPTGHIGLSVSSKAHEEVWPAVCEWFVARSSGEGEPAERRAREATPTEPAVGDEGETAVETESGEPTGERREARPEGAPRDGRAAQPRASEAGDPEAADTGDANLEAITGVGPTYADRLRDAGFRTLEALAAADPEEVAERVSVAESRVAEWVEQAAELV